MEYECIKNINNLVLKYTWEDKNTWHNLGNVSKKINTKN